MSGRIARIDELELYPIEGQDGLTWRPVRRHFDIQAFGVNAYTADEAGKRVVEEHREEGGHEELYVVVSGRAIFMVDLTTGGVLTMINLWSVILSFSRIASSSSEYLTATTRFGSMA